MRTKKARPNPLNPNVKMLVDALLSNLGFPANKAPYLIKIMERLDLDIGDVINPWKKRPASWVAALELLDYSARRRTGSYEDIFLGAADVDGSSAKINKELAKAGIKGEFGLFLGRHPATTIAASLGDKDAMRSIVEIIANKEAHVDIMEYDFATDDEMLAALDARVAEYMARYDGKKG